VVVIPPAWGRTKETLLPLAATITAMFDAAGEAVSVVRFDGIRKRGESYNDPSCRRQGAEHHRFTFSQGIRDIHAVVGGLRGLVQFRDSKIILVTFSAASIDGRRAIATDSAGISGWVSVVGSADLQSMMRVVSGGVDYVAGVEQGLEFGLQEILGVEVDIGLAGKDALRERIAFLEDACRDLQGLTIPISWIHGRFDAWMDLERARLLLASGDPSNRRLIIVPTGHQLRTSREALEVFQLVAAEIGRMALGREISNRLPGLEDLSARRAAERSRLPRRDVDRRSFWRTYLLGRDGSLGIELMTSARAYRSLMAEQVEALQVKPGDWIADIGSGTGSLLSELSGRDVRGVRVHELDYIKEALLRARSRSECAAHGAAIAPRYVACDLGGANGLCFPYRDGVFDSVLASLFISYVDEPQLVLREIRRVLKPRGRLVMSGLRRDADVSKLFTEAIAEMQRGEGASRLKESGNLDLSRLSRQFLNDATRLMDLEEEGFFEFRDSSEMERLLRDAGFTVTRTWRSFGDPPQAVAVVARRGD
jgi:ubiquinone/menaquinone biosynthesis C-methylase UbiE